MKKLSKYINMVLENIKNGEIEYLGYYLKIKMIKKSVEKIVILWILMKIKIN